MRQITATATNDASALSGPDDPRWLELVEAVLSHAQTTASLLQSVLSLKPVPARAHALRGLTALILGRHELRPAARDALQQARTAVAAGTSWPGDEAYAAALTLWLDDNPLDAAEVLEDALHRNPTDLLAFKIAQSIRFMQGDAQGMLLGATRQAAITRPGLRFAGYVQGALAFAREELGDYARAEAAGRLATDLSPRDVWGRHAVAHVFEMTGRVQEGRNWLSRPQDWAHCNNFGCHMWWHLALFELERGDHRRVIAIYDEMIRATPTDDYRDVANSASLLMRLELDGIAVGHRWHELALIAANRIDDHSLVFADLHYLLALTAVRDMTSARALVVSLGESADTKAHSGDIIRGPGLAMAEATLAFAQERYATAVDLLLAARGGNRAIGGSIAQRDVFEQMLIEAAIRANRIRLAESLLRERLAARGGRNRFALSRLAVLSCRPKVGLAALAATQSRAMPAH